MTFSESDLHVSFAMIVCLWFLIFQSICVRLVNLNFYTVGTFLNESVKVKMEI